jgi:hypothetical protein
MMKLQILVATAITAGVFAAPRTNALAHLPAGDFVARLYYTDQRELTNLYRHDIHYVNKTERYARVGVNSNLYAQFIHAGWTVLVDEAATADLHPEISPFSFNGGYREVQENYTTMRAVTAAYPTITEIIDYGDSQNKMQGGETHGGQFNAGFDLLAVKITNKQIPGPKPAFFLMCAIHAREITTPEQGMRFIDWLTQRYATDPDVRWLVDNHITYVVPHTNPDGHWIAALGPYTQRKNGHRNGSSTWPPSDWSQYGVDLNRNHSFKWNSGGSSGDPLDLTYRGPSAGSEPEVYQIQSFIQSIFPDQRGPNDTDPAPNDTTGIMISMHSYGDLVLWPWGYTSTTPPNSDGLSTLGYKFATYNGYDPGQSIGLYPTSGTSDEWGYGDLGIAGYTFECGSSFMPSFSDVDRQWNLNRPALLYACKVCRRPYMTPYGPDTLSVTATPSGNNVILTATINDTQNGGQTVAAAEYYIDLPDWRTGAVAHAMSASDGSFNSSVETVTATLNAGVFANGQHVLLMRGRDSGGNWGPYSAAFANLQDVPPPFVDITTPNQTVPYETMTFTVQGTNAPAVVGGMTWTNAANGAAGTLAAVSAWQIASVPLAVGDNAIVVRGTNILGVTAQDVITITRAAALPPAVDITNTAMAVSYDVTAAAIGGTKNASTIGRLAWINTLNNAQGSIVALSSWTIAGIPLAVGANLIRVTGTNAMHVSASDTVTITRGDIGSGAPWTFILGGWCTATMMTINGTNNLHVVGGLRWVNLRNGAGGSLAATSAWTIRTRYFEPGDNTVWVYGTNALGETSSDSITITAIGPPFVDITNNNATVANSISATAIGGTNNASVAGGLRWTNTLTAGHGAFAAAASWAVAGIGLDVGQNDIVVVGTNAAGDTALDTVTIVRAAAPYGPAAVDIIESNFTVPYNVATVTITGTNSAYIVGTMNFESFIGPDSIDWGEFPAVSPWSIAVQLGVGLNEIYVWGTNGLGEDGWDYVLITREPQGAAPPKLEQFSIRLSNDFATPILTWSNTVATVLACTGECYTANSACWFVRAADVLPPWADTLAPLAKAAFYRLTAGTATSAYAVGKITLAIRQSDGVGKAENWVASPFDFIDAAGNSVPFASFDALGLSLVVNNEAGLPSRRDAVASQSDFGGTVLSATRGNGVWFASLPVATNWYRNRMYKIIINKTHPGTPRTMTLVGMVPTNSTVHVATIHQSDGVASAENWCAAWFPWPMPFDAAGLTAVVNNDSGLPSRRDRVSSQDGAAVIYATRGNGVWLSSTPQATNLCPGVGYNVIINKAHPGTSRAWLEDRMIP